MLCALCTLCCPNGNFFHGKLGSLSSRKASCSQMRYPPLTIITVHAGSFRVSTIRRTLIYTAGSLTCVRDHSYACVYTRRLGTPPTASQHDIFDLDKLSQIVLVLMSIPALDIIRCSKRIVVLVHVSISNFGARCPSLRHDISDVLREWLFWYIIISLSN